MLYEYLKTNMLMHPDSVLSDGKLDITYQELVYKSEKFGGKLSSNIYGILCESELNTTKYLLSCLFAGKTAVILSSRYGKKHNEKIIKKMNLTNIITDNGIISTSNDFANEDVLSDVAVILCTSGTTGDPKGAMMTKENIKSNIQAISGYFNINDTDKILISRPLYHCAVLVGELLISLVKGLNIRFENGDFSPSKLMNILSTEGISVMCGTPTIFYHLSSMIIKSIEKACLKKIALSGECMTQTTAKKIRQAFPNADIYNVYGLTEAGPRVSYLPADKFDEFPMSVGLPLDLTQIKISSNELLVKSNSVMMGYYGDIKSSEEKIKNGWLYTGDVARIEDGYIYIECRKDDMMIRCGMNIYPREIEDALKSQEGIFEAMAFGQREGPYGEKIILNVVTDNLSEFKVYEICRKTLPLYMLPDKINIIDALPRNASGKVLRRISND